MIEYYHEKKGKVSTLPKSGKVWVNLIDPTDAEITKIGKAFFLHPLTIEDMVHRAPRIKIETFNTYTFCVFDKVGKGALRPMFFVLGSKFCISMSMSGFAEIDTSIQKTLLKKGPAWIFHHILDTEIDNFVPHVTRLEKLILALEKRAFDASDEIPREIMKLRGRVSRLKTTLVSQHEKIAMLVKQEAKIIPKELKPYMRDVYDHTYHTARMVESLRENLRAVFETYQSTVTQNLNNVMKVLSIIATIMLPLTVISGIWGTNFVDLPGKFHQYGFWIMIGFMALLSLAMLMYFKRKKWY